MAEEQPVSIPAGDASRGQRVTAVLSVLVVIGFFGALWLVIGLERVNEPALLLLGGLGSAFAAVINYYLGSSIGSSVKTALLGGGK